MQIDGLVSGLPGRVITPGDDAWEAARHFHSGSGEPDVIVHAESVADVAAAVRWAASEAVPIMVRGGGHSAWGEVAGGLTIDLGALDGVQVEGTLVRVGGGAKWGHVAGVLADLGLGISSGDTASVGVGGLTLGGGIGWMVRAWGLAADQLVGAQVVTASGDTIEVTDAAHPELLWALRGGGGNFGVVTRFDFRAHRVGPTVLGGMLVYPWDRAAEAFRASRDLMATAPEELTIFDVALTAPPEPPFPPELQGGPVAIVGVAWSGDLDAGERVLAPLREQCPPVVDLVAPMPYVALQTMLDATAPHHWNYYDRMHHLPEVGDEFIDTLLAGFEDVPAPQAHVVTGWMGGAIDRVRPGATAFGHREARAFTWIIGCSGDEPVGPVRDWAKRLWADTERFATGGVYVNALDTERSVRDAYADEVWDRLVHVKRRYDPEGLFRGNGIG